MTAINHSLLWWLIQQRDETQPSKGMTVVMSHAGSSHWDTGDDVISSPLVGGKKITGIGKPMGSVLLMLTKCRRNVRWNWPILAVSLISLRWESLGLPQVYYLPIMMAVVSWRVRIMVICFVQYSISLFVEKMFHGLIRLCWQLNDRGSFTPKEEGSGDSNSLTQCYFFLPNKFMWGIVLLTYLFSEEPRRSLEGKKPHKQN